MEETPAKLNQPQMNRRLRVQTQTYRCISDV